MSRVGQAIINIPNGVEVKKVDNKNQYIIQKFKPSKVNNSPSINSSTRHCLEGIA